MAETIPPRRGESVVDENGIPTIRFFEYLEGVSTQVNETIPDTEIDTSTINLSVGGVGALAQKVRNLETIIGINPADTKLADQVHALELISIMPVNSSIARLQDQIDELKLLVT